jgi:hypothetical protein
VKTRDTVDYRLIHILLISAETWSGGCTVNRTGRSERDVFPGAQGRRSARLDLALVVKVILSRQNPEGGGVAVLLEPSLQSGGDRFPHRVLDHGLDQLVHIAVLGDEPADCFGYSSVR